MFLVCVCGKSGGYKTNEVFFSLFIVDVAVVFYCLYVLLLSGYALLLHLMTFTII